MLQPNISNRLISLIKVWISIVLIVATLIASFCPLITLRVKDENGSVGTTISELVEKIDGAEGLEFPDEIGVSMPNLISSIKVISQLASMVKDTANSESGEEVEENVISIKDLLETPEGRETVIITMAFVATVVDGFDMESNGIGGMLNVIVTAWALIFVLIFTMIMPIVIAIITLVNAIRVLGNLNTPEKVAGKVGSVLPSIITLPILYLLFQSYIPGMGSAIGSTLIFIFAILSVVLSAVCARLRKYTEKDCKYSIIAQSTSLLGIVGFVVYFFNIIKANVFRNFISGDWLLVTAEVVILDSNIQGEIPNGHSITPLLIFVATIFIFASVGYFSKVAGRFALSVKNKRGKAKDVQIVSAVLILLSYILPSIVMNKVYDYSSIGWSEELSFLSLDEAEKSAFSLSLVGIIIMLVAEIALIILKKACCPTITNDDVIQVITGQALSPEEKLEQAKDVIEQLSTEAVDKE